MDHMIGEIVITQGGALPAASFVPCDGRLLPLSDGRYHALFSVIGSRYGGNGSNNFAVPDLRGHKLAQAGCSMHVCFKGIFPQRG